MVFPLLLLPFSLFLQASGDDGTCGVAGTVVDSVTGEAVRKARVWLEREERRAVDGAVVQTGERGEFSVRDLEEGTYRVRVERSGYLEVQGGRMVVRLRRGERLAGVAVRLVRGAVIAGTIRDGDGEPVERARVVLGRFTYEYGEGMVEGIDSVDTNDRGEYRFFGLPGGRYYVSAEPRGGGPEVLTLYPAARDVAGATALTVEAGRQLSGVDIQMARARMYRVDGVVRNADGAKPMTVILRDSLNAGMREHELSTSGVASGGGFLFRAVPAGRYELEARQGSLLGKTKIEVDGDMDGVGVTLGRSAEISFTFSVEGEEKPDLGGIHWFLTTDGRNGVAMGARTVPPGSYRLQVEGRPLRKYFVKSAVAGGEDVLANGLTVAGQTKITVQVVLSAAGGRLRGIVTDGGGRPVAGALVLLAAEGPRSLGRYRTATADQHGQYEFTAVAPGEYRAYAWEEVEGEEWRDPAFLRNFEKLAGAVSLGEREERALGLRVGVVGR